jgi:hypothetical protein
VALRRRVVGARRAVPVLLPLAARRRDVLAALRVRVPPRPPPVERCAVPLRRRVPLRREALLPSPWST